MSIAEVRNEPEVNGSVVPLEKRMFRGIRDNRWSRALRNRLVILANRFEVFRITLRVDLTRGWVDLRAQWRSFVHNARSALAEAAPAPVVASATGSEAERGQRVLNGDASERPAHETAIRPLQEGHSVSGDKGAVPIVFTHYFACDYLQYSLGQARRWNPEAPIVLLGDADNDVHDNVVHRRFADYSSEADEFGRIYRHFNTTWSHYSLFDFKRWFILKEFMIREGIEQCLYVDSDTLLYCDVSIEQQRFANHGMTLSGMLSGNTCFINGLDTLSDFCAFLFDIYTRRNRYYFDRIVAQFALRRKNGLKGGACDMTALQLFMLDNYGRIGEVATVADGAVFDPNIRTPDPGFEMESGLKRVYWRDGVPYGRYLRTGEIVRFCSLHFQGKDTKVLMKEYCR